MYKLRFHEISIEFLIEMYTSISIPANKCGLVIGKGGETIKNINSSSGAHCRVDKSVPSSSLGMYFSKLYK